MKPLTTWNPLLASWQPFKDIGQKLAASSSVADHLRSIFAPPEWLPAGSIAAASVTGARAKHDHRPQAAVARYVGVSFVVVLGAAVAWLFAGSFFDARAGASVVCAVWLAWSFGSLGALLDGSKYAWPSEVARGVAAIAIVLWLHPVA